MARAPGFAAADEDAADQNGLQRRQVQRGGADHGVDDQRCQQQALAVDAVDDDAGERCGQPDEQGRDPDPAIQAPFARAAARRGELRTWPDGEHTLDNHAAERDATVDARADPGLVLALVELGGQRPGEDHGGDLGVVAGG